jgi:hypothetical protein
VGKVYISAWRKEKGGKSKDFIPKTDFQIAFGHWQNADLGN